MSLILLYSWLLKYHENMPLSLISPEKEQTKILELTSDCSKGPPVSTQQQCEEDFAPIWRSKSFVVSSLKNS